MNSIGGKPGNIDTSLDDRKYPSVGSYSKNQIVTIVNVLKRTQ